MLMFVDMHDISDMLLLIIFIVTAWERTVGGKNVSTTGGAAIIV